MLRVFKGNGTKLQCIVQGDKLYFKAKEVALALEYADPKDAIKVHVRDKYKIKLSELRRELNRLPSNLHQDSLYVTESGLYELIFSSKMPKAEEFQDWVLEEVLPTLRKTGKYEIKRRFDLHKKVLDYIRKYYPQMLIAPGLGELQDSDGKRIKCWQKGYQRGQPDLLLLNAHVHYRGFCIELKTPKGDGRLSPDQQLLLKRYEENGYKVLISSDYDEICRAIAAYEEQIRIPCRWCCKRFRNMQTLATHLKIFHRIYGQG